MREAFLRAKTMPSFLRAKKKELFVNLATALSSNRGFTNVRSKGRQYADGPRPASAGPVTMFDKLGDT